MGKLTALSEFITKASEFLESPSAKLSDALIENLKQLLNVPSTVLICQSCDTPEATISEACVYLLRIVTSVACLEYTALIKTCLNFLSNILAYFNDLRGIVKSQLGVHIALSKFLYEYGYDEDDIIVQKCLCLLEHVTSAVDISLADKPIQKLVDELLGKLSDKSAVCASALHILSNLARDSPAVQSYIVDKNSKRRVSKVLVSNLRHTDQAARAYALSLLVHAVVEEDKERFIVPLLMTALELVISLLLTTTDREGYAALDLFDDLTKTTKFKDLCMRHTKLSVHLKKIVKSCFIGESDVFMRSHVSRCLRFLNVFAESQVTRQIVRNYLWSNSTCSTAEEPQHDGKETNTGLSVLFQYGFHKFDSCAPVYACKIIQNIYLLEKGIEGSTFAKSVASMLEVPLQELSEETGSNLTNIYVLANYTALFDLLSVLGGYAEFKEVIKTNFHVSICKKLAEQQYKNMLLFHMDELRQLGITMVCSVIIALSVVSVYIPEASNCLHDCIQNENLPMYLASAITSSDPEYISRGIRCIFIAHEQLDLEKLSQALLPLNSEIVPPDIRELFPCNNLEDTKSLGHSPPDVTLDDINELADLCDSVLARPEMKTSKIYDLYQERLKMFTAKQRTLENTLNSIIQSIKQHETLLEESKSTEIAMNMEHKKLCALLTESKKTIEDKIKEREKCESELSDIKNKVEASEAHNAELQNECDVKQAELEAVRVKMKEVTEENERKKRALAATLKEVETELEEARIKYSEKSEKLKAALEDVSELNHVLSSARESCSAMQEEKEDLANQVHKLKISCQRHEMEIRDNDEIIKNLEADLEKHRQITTLIHEMSSGKGDMRKSRRAMN